MIPRLILADRNPAMIEAWKSAFSDLVTTGIVRIISCNDIVDLVPDAMAIVSPANSFGDLSGGVDLAYKRIFGVELEERLRLEIQHKWNGEVPVGCAAVIPLSGGKGKYFISAPTMRVPQNVSKSSNAYLSFRAALFACMKQNLQGAVLCPGLCTSIGRMSQDVAARQMREAYDDVTLRWNNKQRAPLTLSEATAQELRFRC